MQAERLGLVEYMSTWTDNSECMRCTIPYGSTPTNVTRYRKGKGCTPKMSCTRNYCIPYPKRFSEERAAPSLRTVWK